jgi:hypothetical protein
MASSSSTPNPALSPFIPAKINAARFYFEWSGHPIADLASFHATTLVERQDKPIIYLAGDSSLDNKAWLHKSVSELGADIPDIYSHVFSNTTTCAAQPKPDVAFWMNSLFGSRATCINTAVEATMLRDRDEQLLPHDTFIRDNLRPQDILIVSVGANDIALRPLPMTIFHMLQLAWLTPRKLLEYHYAPSLPYFAHLFGAKVQDYITRLTAITKPRAIIVCMIYFPLEAQFKQQSWASHQLRALGYNSFPGQLQAAIRAMFELATRKIVVPGTEVVPCALHEVLDGKSEGDYTARVEPNHEGGRKMAERFVEILEGVVGGGECLEGKNGSASASGPVVWDYLT